MTLRRTALKALSRMEDGWDALRYGMLGQGNPEHVEIVCFAGYRNASRVSLRGRVIAARNPIDPKDSTLRRLRIMLGTYHSREVPNVALEVSLHGRTHQLTTDREGYFDLDFEDDQPLPDETSWELAHTRSLSVPTVKDVYDHPVLAPACDQRLGIISDVDDTVLETGATNFLKNWRRVLIQQPDERDPVPGAVKLYRTLADRHGVPANPVFYVSSSPWNLYPFLHRFMAHNDLPFGPLFLKDWGITDTTLLGGSHVTHKVDAVERILAFYPRFRFLLIGDNGQKDIDVYTRVVEDYPDNVAGVFIRDVRGECEDGGVADGLAAIAEKGVPTFCGASMDAAIPVARKIGFEQDPAAGGAAMDPVAQS